MHNTCSCVSLKVSKQNLCKPGKHLNKLKIVSLHIWDELFYCVGGKSFVYADKNVFMRERLTKFLCDNYDNFHTQPQSINRALQQCHFTGIFDPYSFNRALQHCHFTRSFDSHSLNKAVAVSLDGDFRPPFIKQSRGSVTLRGFLIPFH